MANFHLYKDKILLLEGGFQKDPADSGNYNSLGDLVGTNLGISAGLYEQIIKRPPTTADMKAITKQTAISIFKGVFWNKGKADLIDSQEVAEIVIDHFINAGRRALRMFQTVINTFGFNIKEDAAIGTKTLSAANSINSADLNNAYKKARINYYKDLVIRKPSLQKFLKGWLSRVNQFPWLEKKK